MKCFHCKSINTEVIEKKSIVLEDNKEIWFKKYICNDCNKTFLGDGFNYLNHRFERIKNERTNIS